jgi:cystathionine gamma-synthase
MTSPDAAPLHTETTVVAGGRPPRVPGGPLNEPITLSSTYHAGAPVAYGRVSNPTWESLEDVLGTLEGGRALSFASGMGAVNAALELVRAAGGKVVAPTHSYSGTAARMTVLATTRRITLVHVDMQDADAIAAAVQGADLLWLESPTNPAMEVCDLAAAATAAHTAGALVVCDSTFATPLGQQPLKLGCDVVLHSATKFLAGHSDVLLGALVTADDGLYEQLHRARTLLGAIPGPTEAWLALRGIRTLALRMERAQANAGELATRLQQHAAVTRVRYPGLATDPGHAVAQRQMSGYGALVGFETIGDAHAAEAVCAATQVWTHATSLGGVESTLERRRRWAEESADIPDTLIRLSVGIEHIEDLWADLSQALDRIVQL